MAELNVPTGTLMQGDNLDFLRGINSETIDLIATDPPFNKGKDFHATPESLAAGASFQDRWDWDDDIEGAWIDDIRDNFPAVWEVIDAANHTWGRDMGAFLCYMGVRLMAMHRVLKPTGSLYLHCDQTASHYLKLILDSIFGVKQFRNEIVWHYGLGGYNVKRWYPRKHDVILYYAKSKESHHNKIRGNVSKWMEQKYSKQDDNGKYFIQNGVKYYLKGGKPIDSVWDNDNLIEFTLNQNNPERIGYPTQKPIALYKRIIEASSNPGDVVLDPFCGCATTLIAAQQLDRKWLGMDIWPTAIDLVRNRLETECPSFGPTVYHATTPPNRTDDGEFAAPNLKSKNKKRTPTPPGEKMSREKMLEVLIAEQQNTCAGCDRKYEDPLIWEIDHITPRSDGGHNGISNRALLCPPCNRIKSNQLTLSGLRRENQRRERL